MKRIWISVTFISIIIGLCVYEQIYVKNVADEMHNRIEAIQKADHINIELKDDIDSLQRYWDKKHMVLLLTCDHNTIDEIEVAVYELEYKDDNEIKNALADAKALTKNLYDNEKLSFGNVF